MHLDEEELRKLTGESTEHGTWRVWLYHTLPAVVGIALAVLALYGALAVVAGVTGGQASCTIGRPPR